MPVLALVLLLLVLGISGVVLSRRRSRPVLSQPLADRATEATREMAFRKIVVPTIGTKISDRMVSLACKLAKPGGAQVEVVYVVEVPMALPATAELPEEVSLAAEALAEAELIGRAHGVPIRGRVTKSRFAGKAIIDVANQQDADLIVLAAANRQGDFGRTGEYVFRNAGCDVIIERPKRN